MLYMLQNTCTLSFNLAIFASQKQKQKKTQLWEILTTLHGT